MSTVTAIVDGHVHLHACHEPRALLGSAIGNLSQAVTTLPVAPRAYFLLLAECQGDDMFGRLSAQAVAGSADPALGAWTVHNTGEPQSLLLTDGKRSLFLVAGRQIACKEGLEVLVLGCTDRFPDGRPIRELLRATEPLGVPRVIPWGPGKWLFSRGRLLKALLAEFRAPTLFLGDEGGRPGFWGYPRHFTWGARLGVRDLPGTDPLPFAHDIDKVGRMGFGIRIDLDPQRPAASLLRAVTSPDAILARFATLEPTLRFVRNQVGMQLRKRRRAIA